MGIRGRNMRDGVDQTAAEELDRDPGDHSSGTAVSAKVAFDDMANIGALVTANQRILVTRAREMLSRDFILVRRLGGERADACEAFVGSGGPFSHGGQLPMPIELQATTSLGAHAAADAQTGGGDIARAKHNISQGLRPDIGGIVRATW